MIDFSSGKQLNSFTLKNLVRFEKNEGSFGGTFVYTREHKASISCLPVGYAQAAARLTKFSNTLQNMTHSLAFIDHGLVTSFLNKKSQWFSDFSKEEVAKHQLHICAVLCVRKLSPGSTSVLRLTQQANCKYKSMCGSDCPCKPAKTEEKREEQHLDEDQNVNHNDKQHDHHHNHDHHHKHDHHHNHDHHHKHHNHDHHHNQDVHEKDSRKSECKITLSLNDTIQNYQQQLPVIADLALALRLSVSAGACDIQKYFTQIKMDNATSFRQAALVYRCWKTDLPTYANSTEGKANEKSILIPKYCAFGISDLSQTAQACSNQIAEIFESYLKSNKAHRETAVETLNRAGIAAPWLSELGWEWRFYSTQCDNKLRSELYIDDHAASVNLDNALSFLHQKSLNSTTHCTVPETLCNVAECTVHHIFSWSDSLIKSVSDEIQLNVTAYTILALQYSSMNFKSFDSNSKHVKILNKLIEITRPPQILPKFEKPAAELVRLEQLPSAGRSGVHCTHVAVGGLEHPPPRAVARGEIINNHPPAPLPHRPSTTKAPADGECGEKGSNGKKKGEGISVLPAPSDPPAVPKPFLCQLGVEYFNDGTCALRAKTLNLKNAKGQKGAICHTVEDYDKWLAGKSHQVTKREIAVLLGHYYDQNLGLHYFFPTLLVKHVMANCSRGEAAWDWTSLVPKELLHFLRASITLYFKIAHTRSARCTVKHTLHATNLLIGAGDTSSTMHSTCHFLIQIHTVAGVTTHNVQLVSTGVYLNKSTVLSIVYWEATALCKTVQRSAELHTLLNKLGFYCHPSNVINLTDSSAVCFMAKTPPAQLEKRFSHIISKMTLHLLSIGTTPQNSVFFFNQNNRKRNNGCPFMADIISKIPAGLTEEELVHQLPFLWEQSLMWLSSPVESWSFITNFPPNVSMKNCTSDQFKLKNVTTAELCKERFLPTGPGLCHLSMQLGHTAIGKTQCIASVQMDVNFQRLLKRKLSKICTKGSAINILSLCKFYIIKLKLLTKLDQKERLKKRDNLLKNLTERTRGLTPFWPSCKVKCGLVAELTCGAKHHIVTFKFFGNLNNTWPHFNCGENKPAKEIMNILQNQINNLPFAWSDQHQPLLTQYIFSVLATQQGPLPAIKNTAKFELPFASTTIHLAIGRKQGLILNHKQQYMGHPIFRAFGENLFGLCIVRYYHLLADHNKRRARLEMLKGGFICAKLEQTLHQCELVCQECRVRRGMQVAKNSGLYIPPSGSSLNLASLTFHNQSHCYATDVWGPLECRDGTVHCILFVSTLTNMCYTFVLQQMDIAGVIGAVQQLAAISGNVKVMISDFASNYSPFADIFKGSEFDSDTEKEEMESNPHRSPRNPLKRLLKGSRLEGQSGAINWKLICAQNHSQNSNSEVAVKIIKRALRSSRFFEKCRDFNLSKVAAFIAVATTIYNSRPVCVLDDGECYNPYDLLSLTTAGASTPTDNLILHSNSKDLRIKFNEYKVIRGEIQNQIFTQYCRFLYLNSAYKERGKFHFRSDKLQPGDLIISKAAFVATKNITSSIRRIYMVNNSKRTATVYHIVEKDDKFDTELFSLQFYKCKSLVEKQKLVRQYFGRFSFQTLDLREVTFLCGHDSENLELSMRRTRKDPNMNAHENLTSFPFEKIHEKLRCTDFSPSIKAADIPDEAAKMLMNDDFGDIIVKGGNLPKEQINVINRTPILTKREKPRLILKWAEPEYEIIDLPKLEKQKPRRRK